MTHPLDLERLRSLLARVQVGHRLLPWALWTSNSYRRIKTADVPSRCGGKSVLEAIRCHDGCLDLSMPEDQLFALVELVNALPAILDRLAEVDGGWRPMSDAPRDGSYILAIVAADRGHYLKHNAGRMFVIRHQGVTGQYGYDMGWAIYPGFGGASDYDFTHWRPLPPAPTDQPSSQPGRE